MNFNTPSLLFTGITAALLGGFLGAWGERQLHAPSQEAADVRLDKRLRKIEFDLERLQQQQQAQPLLELFGRRKSSLADSSSTTESEPIQPDVHANASEEVLLEKVRALVDQAMWEGEESHRLGRDKMLNDQVDARVRLVVERLALPGVQSQAVRSILEQQARELHLLMHPDEEHPRPKTRTEMKERVTAIRQHSEEQLRRLMSPAQFERYEELIEQEGFDRLAPHSDNSNRDQQ